MNEQHDNATLRKWTVAMVCSKRMKVPSGLINNDILQGRAKSSKNDRGYAEFIFADGEIYVKSVGYVSKSSGLINMHPDFPRSNHYEKCTTPT